MACNFSESRTKENLMRAFAGESQARNRYTIAAEKAHKEGMNTVADIFLYTADQERAHAERFYDPVSYTHLDVYKRQSYHMVDKQAYQFVYKECLARGVRMHPLRGRSYVSTAHTEEDVKYTLDVFDEVFKMLKEKQN